MAAAAHVDHGGDQARSHGDPSYRVTSGSRASQTDDLGSLPRVERWPGERTLANGLADDVAR